MSDADIIKGIRAPGRFDAIVGSEAEAKRLVKIALPHAIELPPATSGQLYPSPPKTAKAWYQVQPAEPQVDNNFPHVKYVDWSKGKRGRGGSWGHLFFPPAVGS